MIRPHAAVIALVILTSLSGCTEGDGSSVEAGPDQPWTGSTDQDPQKRFQTGSAFRFDGFSPSWRVVLNGTAHAHGLVWSKGDLALSSVTDSWLLAAETGAELGVYRGAFEERIDDSSYLIVEHAKTLVLYVDGNASRLVELNGGFSIQETSLLLGGHGLRLEDLITGKLQWSKELDPAGDPSRLTGRILLTKDKALVSWGKELLALNASDGQRLWNTSIPGDGAPHGPATDGARVYLFGSILMALDAKSGIPIWEQFWGFDIPHPPLVVDGRVFAYVDTGVVHAFDAASGKQLWATRVESTSCRDLAWCWKDPVGPAYGSGVLFVPGRDGNLTAIDARSGEILATTTITGTDRTHNTDAITPIVVDNQLFLAINRRTGTETVEIEVSAFMLGPVVAV